MSGFELIGVAATVFQIADLGAELSIKLCTFYHKVKNADQNIQSLSNDVALTSTVLRHLGDNLEHDCQGELYSNGALNTAHEVLEECRKVFQQIGSAIDDPGKDPGKGLFQRAAKRVGFVIMEPQLDALKSNLERLKSTMLLMLNVIMYARQIRDRRASNVLEEQRELIQNLMEEKRINDQRFRQLTNALDSSSISDDETLTDERDPSSASVDAAPDPESFASKELRVYCDLIEKMLSDIDSCKSEIETSRHLRITSSVFTMNTRELVYFEFTHGGLAGDYMRTRFRQLYDRAHLPLPAVVWGRASDNRDYRQIPQRYPAAVPGQRTSSDGKSEPATLNLNEPRQDRKVEIVDGRPESSRLATTNRTTHSIPSSRRSHGLTEQRLDPSGDDDGEESGGSSGDETISELTYTRETVGAADSDTEMVESATSSLSEVHAQQDPTTETQDSLSAVTTGEDMWSAWSGWEYADVIILDSEPEHAEPDATKKRASRRKRKSKPRVKPLRLDKDTPQFTNKSVDSLLFEWTTLAKDEVSAN